MSTTPAALRSAIATTFPDADLDRHPIDFGDAHLRFELGGDHSNGSDERISQATQRAVALFRHVFSVADPLILIINDWDWAGREMWPSEPAGHLLSLIGGQPGGQQFEEIVGPAAGSSYHRLITPALVRDLDYRRIFEGITNREQGRLPRINESVYFVSAARGLVFHMYDDRGCLIYADAPEKLQSLYAERQAWLVDFHRARFDAMFGSPGTTARDEP
jgi:hypothetical protein